MIRKEQVTLRTLADWREHAPPKSEKHWKEGRSAAEMARTWVGLESPALPPEVDRVLRSHPDFGEVQEWSAEPEARVKFDDMGGEPSNADLLLHGHDENGAFIVVVEGKADEPFGSTVDVTLRDALERRVVNPRSRGVDRVQQLAGALFHERSGRSSPVVTSLPYQLLTATAAALAEAARQEAARAVLLVHEFHTELTAADKTRSNADDLNRFVQRLSRGAVDEVEEGRLLGPFQVPGHPPFSPAPDLYVGKAVRTGAGGQTEGPRATVGVDDPKPASRTVDDIVTQVHDVVTQEKLNQLDAVAARMVAAQDDVRGFLRTIHQRPETVFHISASRVKERNPHITLSVRVHGVQAGEVRLTGSAERRFTPSRVESHFADCWEDPDVQSLPWRDPGVRRFLDAVSRTVAAGGLGGREAALEAATLRAIQGGEDWRYQTPVLYPAGSGGIPFQFPLPIRARDEVGAAGGTGAGYADILLRTGTGGSSRLRVLELKRPGVADAASALDQAVAYAAALNLLMEREPAYRVLLGYGNVEERIPPLEATAFVEDSPANRAELSRAIERLDRAKTKLPKLRLSARLYRWTPGGKVEVAHEVA